MTFALADLAHKTPEELLSLSVDMASETMPLLVKELAHRSLEPTITTNSLLAISDHLLKLINGYKARTAPTPGTGFSITINMPGAEPVLIGSTIDLPYGTFQKVAWDVSPEF